MVKMTNTHRGEVWWSVRNANAQESAAQAPLVAHGLDQALAAKQLH